MAKQEKNIKSGFIIKLSSETVQKLSEEEASNKISSNQASNDNKGTVDTSLKNKEIGKERTPTEDKTANTTAVQKLNDKEGTDKETGNKNTDASSGNTSEDTWGSYTPYITYEEDVAIYTDPSTLQKYTWCHDSKSWIKKATEEAETDAPSKVYSYENDMHVYTDPDGSKYFWDVEKKAWIPKVDDDFLAYYQMSYGFVDNTTKEDSKTESDKKSEIEKKDEQTGLKRKAEPKWFDATDENNTKVYVSNLPLDTTEEEFVEFMQKCGLVMRDLSTQKMKVKLYMDKEQKCFKGDALCTYIKVESVDLALKLLDGSEYKGNKIRVEKAYFQMKGNYDPTLKPKKKKKKELEKLKRMQEKLFDWRPEKIIGEKSKNDKVVIVKNLFHPTDFDKEVQLILDYQQDMREECSKCGEVKKVVVFDRHPEGVAQINMKEPEQADAVVQLINGRWFGKRKLTAEIWDGRTKYKIAETDSEISKRIDKWEKFLEGGNENDQNKNTTEDKQKEVVPDVSKVEDPPTPVDDSSTTS